MGENGGGGDSEEVEKGEKEDLEVEEIGYRDGR